MTSEHDHSSLPVAQPDPVSDTYHGTSITDPYRWLEDADDPRTVAWQQETKRHADAWFGKDAHRKAVEQRFADVISTTRTLALDAAHGWLYQQRLEPDSPQSVLIRRRIEGGDATTVLDPFAESGDPHCSLDWWRISPSGRYLVYGVSTGGDEWSELRVRDLASIADLDLAIPRCRAGSVAWNPSESGFWYTRYPTPGSVPIEDEPMYRRVYWHELGADPAGDPIILGDDRPKEDLPWVHCSPNGRWLLVVAHEGWSRTELWLADLSSDDRSFRNISPSVDDTCEFVTFLDDDLIISTFWDDDRGRALRFACGGGGDVWTPVFTLIDGETLGVARPTASGFAATVWRAAIEHVVVFDHHGRRVRDLPNPHPGSVSFLVTHHAEDDVIWMHSSFADPPTVFRIAHVDADVQVVAGGLTPGTAMRVRQEWCTSHDGTRISMFIVDQAESLADLPRPTVIWGYGGFNWAIGSEFDPDIVPWVASGGVYVVPNLRGGGEYGSRWHEAGRARNKQNTFDDAIAVCEHLVERGITTREQLGICGLSNGGLMVGAVIMQRPELVRAAHADVPLMDMLRYHLFQLARIWIPEYGCADDPDDFRSLIEWSPYHHVRPGVAYPSLLITTAENDTRVDPMHARKMAARVAAASSSAHPVIFRVSRDAGHGSGTAVATRAQQLADQWIFFSRELGLPLQID